MRVYKTTLIKALEMEIFILSLDLHIKRLATYIVARIHIIKIVKGIKLIYN
jgi:hypothetical protein